MWTRKDLKEKAKARFKVTYWRTVLVAVILAILTGGASAGSSFSTGVSKGMSEGHEQAVEGSVYGSGPNLAVVLATAFFAIIMVLIFFALAIAVSVLLINPLVVGCSRFFTLNLSVDAEVKEVCYNFDRSYKNGVKVMFFRDLYTVLWSFLFIIPGIIKSYEYRMIPYLLAENPDMEKDMAFSLSKQMMQGNKWDAFVLDLSFILWHILSAFTCGILELFYVAPYINMTNAALYVALKDDYQSRQAQVEASQNETPMQI
ncbi:MAG: DUF975 family protein [Hespellia sp.]|nr:DUF975 family protein [Hespellia sp.]